MIILGFVLLVGAVVIAAALIVQNPNTVTFQLFNQSWNIDMRWLVVAGLALTAIGLLGLVMMHLGSVRYMRLRSERRKLAAENERLAKWAAVARPASAGPDTGPTLVPMAQPSEPDPAAVSSDRRGLRDRLPGTRRPPGAELSDSTTRTGATRT